MWPMKFLEPINKKIWRGKSSKGKQQQLMYVAKRKKKLNESSNFTFKKEKLGSMLPLVCLLATFLMIVYKNMN
jgi:hypothetical protein